MTTTYQDSSWFKIDLWFLHLFNKHFFPESSNWDQLQQYQFARLFWTRCKLKATFYVFDFSVCIIEWCKNAKTI